MSSRGTPVDTVYGLTPPPTSSKHRKAEAAAAAAAEAEKAEKVAAAEAARLAELRRRYDLQQQQPKLVTCALCNKSETVGDAIAHKWKNHPFGFKNQAICAACDATTVPFTSSPKLVWKHGGTKSKSKSKRSKSKRSRSKSRSRAHR